MYSEVQYLILLFSVLWYHYWILVLKIMYQLLMHICIHKISYIVKTPNYICIGMGEITLDQTRIWTLAAGISSQVSYQMRHLAQVFKPVWPPLSDLHPQRLHQALAFNLLVHGVGHSTKCNVMGKIMTDSNPGPLNL